MTIMNQLNKGTFEELEVGDIFIFDADTCIKIEDYQGVNALNFVTNELFLMTKDDAVTPVTAELYIVSYNVGAF